MEKMFKSREILQFKKFKSMERHATIRTVDIAEFDPKELEFFYYDILRFYESDVDNIAAYSLRNRNQYNAYLRLKADLDFDLVDNINEIDVNALQKFYYTDSKRNKIRSCFFHLRNAFAHNRIYKQRDGSIILEDAEIISEERLMNGERPHLTMYAKTESFNKLKEIINGVKGLKSLEQ